MHCIFGCFHVTELWNTWITHLQVPDPDCCRESNTVSNQNTRALQEWFRCIITQLMRHCSPQEGVFTHRGTLDSTRGCATPIMDSPLHERSPRWQLTSYFSSMHSACPLFKNKFLSESNQQRSSVIRCMKMSLLIARCLWNKLSHYRGAVSPHVSASWASEINVPPCCCHLVSHGGQLFLSSGWDQMEKKKHVCIIIHGR